MRAFYFCLLLCSVIACTSPLQEIELNIEEQPSVSCFISPQDTIIRAFVTKSVPIGQFRNDTALKQFAKSSKVYINSGSVKVELLYDAVTNFFTLPITKFPITEGLSYRLEVLLPNGKAMTGECTVPETPQGFSVQVDSINKSFDTNYYANYQWNDDGNETNFYRIAGEIIEDNRLGREKDFTKRPLGFDDATALSTFITDAGKQGTAINSPRGNFQEYTALGVTASFVVFRPTVLRAILLSTDKNYYEFHRVILTNRQNSELVEPERLKGNIVGGLGVFAAYNQTEKFITVKR